MEPEEKVEAECNDCDWKGNKDEMIDNSFEEDEQPFLICPKCSSENIYYY